MRHQSTATALSRSEVVILPFATRARLAGDCSTLEALFYRVLGRELVRVQNIARTLGALGSEGRVAAFLLSLSARLGALGYSRSPFDLRMTRRELGSHLGLKLETVSRALSALNSTGVIQVRNRHIDIIDANGLRRVIDPYGAAPTGGAVHLHTNAGRADANNWKTARQSLFQPGLG